MNICVFCSSHTDLPNPIVETAKGLGCLIGRLGGTLVYGGSKRGLMEITAQAAKAAGARVVGVLPTYMICSGGASSYIDEQIAVADLAERKQQMLARADVFVVLPGGVGTLDELMAVYAASVVGEHKKPVYLLNVLHYWDPLIRVFDHFETSGTSRQGMFLKRITVVGSLEELAHSLCSNGE